MKRFLIALSIAAVGLSAVVAAQHVRVNGQSIFQSIQIIGQTLHGDGTVALPGISFTAEPSSGWFRNAAGDLRLSILGADELQVTAGALTIPSNNINMAATASLGFTATGFLSGTGTPGQFLLRNDAITTGVGLDVATDAVLKLRDRTLGAGTGNLDIGAKITGYNGITTAGFGVPAIVASGNVVAATNTGTASIATFTPAAAGTFEVGCNVLVTTSTTHSFSCDVTYTDEGSSARTLVLPMSVSAGGTFITTGLITNVTGVGPYASPVLNIRSAASTAITVRTSAGGTFTTVIYNARGTIKQVS
jgi:hypothetical protein